MEVAFAGGALAEVAGYDARWYFWVLESLDFQGVCRTGGLGDLGTERGGYGVLNQGINGRRIWIRSRQRLIQY